ncbi:MAG: putative Signal transduction histidine kinase [Proteobacteria bacterium]|nr:putative Signal transduction histidine kinase [Pseudomonadota bacterium]
MSSQRLPAQLFTTKLDAEVRLEQPPPGNTSEHSVKLLLHEIQVHQIELQMQNEQLRRIQIALEESHDRYLSLYESAPVAYLTLDVSGQITEANRSAATLLDESHLELRHSRFIRLVAAEDQARWSQNFGQILKHGGQQECPLDMRRKNGSFFNGNLHCSLANKRGVVPELHVVLTDITTLKNTERARQTLAARLSRLTRRERDVLALAIAGIPNKTISVRLGINQRTVENHRAHLHKKMGIGSLLELAQQIAAANVTLESIAEV